MRIGKQNRKTNETEIQLTWNLDGSGKFDGKSGVGFLDHMLDLFAAHGLFDIELKMKGDLQIDGHHSVEDLGICLGLAFKEALGDAKGIRRYASGIIPMDESACQMAIDISNRPFLNFAAELPKAKVGEFETELVQEFFQAFVSNARITLHIWVLAGSNLHHIVESVFKAFGMLLRQALETDPRRAEQVPSTKGIL